MKMELQVTVKKKDGSFGICIRDKTTPYLIEDMSGVIYLTIPTASSLDRSSSDEEIDVIVLRDPKNTWAGKKFIARINLENCKFLDFDTTVELKNKQGS